MGKLLIYMRVVGRVARIAIFTDPESFVVGVARGLGWVKGWRIKDLRKGHIYQGVIAIGMGKLLIIKKLFYKSL